MEGNPMVMVDTTAEIMVGQIITAKVEVPSIITPIMVKKDTKVSKDTIPSKVTVKETKDITIEPTKRDITRALVVLPKDINTEDNIMEESIMVLKVLKVPNMAKRVNTRRGTPPKDFTTLIIKMSTINNTNSTMIIILEVIIKNMVIIIIIKKIMVARNIIEIIIMGDTMEIIMEIKDTITEASMEIITKATKVTMETMGVMDTINIMTNMGIMGIMANMVMEIITTPIIMEDFIMAMEEALEEVAGLEGLEEGEELVMVNEFLNIAYTFIWFG